MASDEDVAATSIGVETISHATQPSGFAKTPSGMDRRSEIAREGKGGRAHRPAG